MNPSMCAAAAFVLYMTGCEALLPERECSVSVNLEEQSYSATKSVFKDLPDSSEFLLDISSANGEALYSGPYGKCPENLLAKGGTYTIEVRSCDFSTPRFDSPQYGDTQVIMIKPGQKADVVLKCSQLNSGVRLNIPPGFLTAYPKAVLFINSDKGKVMYSYTEKRFAFFQPGNISLVMDEDGKEKVLFTRQLEAREMLTLGLNVPGDTVAGQDTSISMQMDTTRVWTYHDVGLGTDGNGKEGQSMDSAYSVTKARERAGEKDVWVYGYIVAGDLTASGADFEGPFTVKTAIAIGPRASVNEKDRCISIQLGSGKVRDALNLVDNPSNLGRKLYVRGDIVESYYGIPGIKNVKEFRL